MMLLVGCQATMQEKESKEAKETEVPAMNNDKILVVYFSQTATTKKISTYIKDVLHTDIYEIQAKIPYTNDDLDYYSGGRADIEQEDKNARVEISNLLVDLNQYDTVFLGYPLWHGQAPRIMDTFIESFDFSNKTIIPYCTSHSSLFGTSDRYLKEKSGNATWIEGQRFSNKTTKTEIETWIHELNINNLKSR